MSAYWDYLRIEKGLAFARIRHDVYVLVAKTDGYAVAGSPWHIKRDRKFTVVIFDLIDGEPKLGWLKPKGWKDGDEKKRSVWTMPRRSYTETEQIEQEARTFAISNGYESIHTVVSAYPLWDERHQALFDEHFENEDIEIKHVDVSRIPPTERQVISQITAQLGVDPHKARWLLRTDKVVYVDGVWIRKNEEDFVAQVMMDMNVSKSKATYLLKTPGKIEKAGGRWQRISQSANG